MSIATTWNTTRQGIDTDLATAQATAATARASNPAPVWSNGDLYGVSLQQTASDKPDVVITVSGVSVKIPSDVAALLGAWLVEKCA